MTESKGKAKPAESGRARKENTGISPARKLFRQYYPFYRYTPSSIKRRGKREVLSFGKIDTKFFLLVVILLIIGLIALFSASYINAINRHKGNAYYYIERQLIFAVTGVVLMFLVSRINYRVFKDLSFFAITVAFFFLVLVLIFTATAISSAGSLSAARTCSSRPSLQRLHL